ncbi:hypothetical protein GJ496_000990 [Pomphorhynchus laevis]|nr:hypothetical protein GJ496_000990 [Pomphorhynchus laevis]
MNDDDLDLLEENLGICRKLKRRRVVMEKDDDEESVLEGKPADVSSVQCIGEADDDFIEIHRSQQIGGFSIRNINKYHLLLRLCIH